MLPPQEMTAMTADLKKGSDQQGPGEVKKSGNAESSPSEGSSSARRALIKAGVVGVPLILTLKGRSAWAQDNLSKLSGSSTFKNTGQ
jgi:hypothetical protein